MIDEMFCWRNASNCAQLKSLHLIISETMSICLTTLTSRKLAQRQLHTRYRLITLGKRFITNNI